MRFPIPTSHQKIPFTGKGSLDEYAYSFLSDLAELHLIFIFLAFHLLCCLLLPSQLMVLFHCMVRHGTVRYGSLLGGFPLGTVPGT